MTSASTRGGWIRRRSTRSSRKRAARATDACSARASSRRCLVRPRKITKDLRSYARLTVEAAEFASPAAEDRDERLEHPHGLCDGDGFAERGEIADPGAGARSEHHAAVASWPRQVGHRARSRGRGRPRVPRPPRYAARAGGCERRRQDRRGALRVLPAAQPPAGDGGTVLPVPRRASFLHARRTKGAFLTAAGAAPRRA